ncbi:MAG: tRNA (adenosine(37)-N6)-threonylcarbamoyltransferase complex transferase subunit TsaD [Spirochaetaceae bacterium]|jgi:N6-L-threonylcarbamoyladenine synthase|nr:tRNA (adenosine(37)-N6)-threonylcarbamoyltransferase complex transferase subunit TsaD [Spirochaetaceae bacterium]
MKILGIESSCDECSASVVEDGKNILSNIIATQIPFHAVYNGVVPEIASRKHTEWIYEVTAQALEQAGLTSDDIDGVAATSQPGLMGSLLVGLTFAKAFAYARHKPFIACDHMLSHLYAARLTEAPPPPYPFLGLLVSGGHTIICKVDDFDAITVLGSSIDDAVGEAFDKVSKHFGWGYPGGKYIDALAQDGCSDTFDFPLARLHTVKHPYDVSYSGLKTAVANQIEQFRKKGAAGELHPPDIAASFQKAAVGILLCALFKAVEDTGISTVVSGGGVAANSYLRAKLSERDDIRCIFPPPELCGDNGAMVAGLGYAYLSRGISSPLNITASARVKAFKRRPKAGDG